MHFLLTNTDKLLGEIVLIRTHNDDLIPAVVTNCQDDKIIDVVMLEEHNASHGKVSYLKNIHRDTDQQTIAWNKWTWLPRWSQQEK